MHLSQLLPFATFFTLLLLSSDVRKCRKILLGRKCRFDLAINFGRNHLFKEETRETIFQSKNFTSLTKALIVLMGLSEASALLLRVV